MDFVRISEQAVSISVHNMNQFTVVMIAYFVLCGVRTEFLEIIWSEFMIHSSKKSSRFAVP